MTIQKVTITNELTGRKFGATKPQDKMQEWVDQQVAKNSWGEPERWVFDEDMTQELQSRIIETDDAFDAGFTDENGNPVLKTRHKVKADYVVTVTDVTLKEERKKRLSEFLFSGRKYKKDREICMSIIDRVAEHNEAQGLTKSQKDQMESDPQLSAILQTAKLSQRPGKLKSLIDAYTPDGTLVTQSLKDELSQILQDHLDENYGQ